MSLLVILMEASWFFPFFNGVLHSSSMVTPYDSDLYKIRLRIVGFIEFRHKISGNSGELYQL